jgi:hypothetical protein
VGIALSPVTNQNESELKRFLLLFQCESERKRSNDLSVQREDLIKHFVVATVNSRNTMRNISQ